MGDKIVQRSYFSWLVVLLVGLSVFFLLRGASYYSTALEERFYHTDHEALKPSGIIGHGLGILGSGMMVFGVAIYMVRKRVKRFAQLGNLKRWLEFHIFLCSVGPLLVLFHTAFKFGGLVSISFWSMLAVVLSGVIGRYIYNQIPRSIHGQEYSLQEVRMMKQDLHNLFKVSNSQKPKEWQNILAAVDSSFQKSTSNPIRQIINTHIQDWRTLQTVKSSLKHLDISAQEQNQVLLLVKQEIQLNHKIGQLQTMQQLFRYWHVAHLPFALIMLVIMVIHIIITLMFGYNWMF